MILNVPGENALLAAAASRQPELDCSRQAVNQVDLHTMSKRTIFGDGTGVRDAPEVIATRRKAKVSSRFRSV